MIWSKIVFRMFYYLDRVFIYCQISRKYYGVWFWFSSTAPYTVLLVAVFEQFLIISANFGILTYSSSFLRQRHFVFLQKEDLEPGMDISLCGASRSAISWQQNPSNQGSRTYSMYVRYIRGTESHKNTVWWSVAYNMMVQLRCIQWCTVECDTWHDDAVQAEYHIVCSTS